VWRGSCALYNLPGAGHKHRTSTAVHKSEATHTLAAKLRADTLPEMAPGYSGRDGVWGEMAGDGGMAAAVMLQMAA